MDLLELVKYEDLPPEQQELADVIGMDLFKTLVREYGGTSVYFPKKEMIERPARDALIRAEFVGDNIKSLAKKYHLSDRQIRFIVSLKQK